MVPEQEVGRRSGTASAGHCGLSEGAQIRRWTGSGESSSAYETVGVYFDTSSQIFGRVYLGTISASVCGHCVFEWLERRYGSPPAAFPHGWGCSQCRLVDSRVPEGDTGDFD